MIHTWRSRLPSARVVNVAQHHGTVAAALASQARRHLAQIDAAMLWLAASTYGCESCGRPACAARLAAGLVTTLVITSASPEPPAA